MPELRNSWHLGAILLVIGLAPPAHAAVTRGNVFACKDTAVLAAGTQLRTKGKGGDDFEKAKIASGDCTSIIEGSVVGIDERKGAMFCIRPSGALDCYWAASAGVDEYGKPQPTSSGSAPQQAGIV